MSANKKPEFLDIIGRLMYDSIELELISEKNDDISIHINCCLVEKKWYKWLHQFFFQTWDRYDVYDIYFTFKGVADKSGTAFVDNHLIKEFLENTEPCKEIDTFYVEPYKDRYILDYLGDGGRDYDAKYDLGYITMQFSFVDCEMSIKKIRDGKVWLIP